MADDATTTEEARRRSSPTTAARRCWPCSPSTSATPSSTRTSSPGQGLWIRVATEAWADAAEVAQRQGRLPVLRLPLGHRLAAVAVRPLRGQQRRRAVPAAHARPLRRRPRLRRRRQPASRCSRRSPRPAPTSGVLLKADVPDDDPRVATWIARLRRRRLARARGPRDVRHRLRRQPRPAPHLPARRSSRGTRCARSSRCSPGS